MTLPMEVDAFTWTAFMGTVGVAVLALIAMVYMLRVVWHALTGEVDADTTDLPTRRPSGHVAIHDGRDHNGALLALQAEQRRRQLRQRLETATSTRGPARLNGRDVSGAPSVPVGKGAA